VAVADRAYASLKLLDRCRKPKKPITFITRLRLDAALYRSLPLSTALYRSLRARSSASSRAEGEATPLKAERLPNLSAVAEDSKTVWAPTTIANWYGETDRTIERSRSLPRRPCGTPLGCSPCPSPCPRARWVSIHDPHAEFGTQALLRTDLDADPKKILSWFVMRRQPEVTFQEVRRHLGFETQRQWSDIAIRRTTPALLGLFSVITLFAHRQMRQATGAFRRAAWYHKRDPTFSDALALVRKELWAHATFCGSPSATDTIKVPKAFVERLSNALCYAA
jgi:hypothetical protein